MSAACQNNDKARGSTVLELIYAELFPEVRLLLVQPNELLMELLPPIHGGQTTAGQVLEMLCLQK